MSDDGAGRRAGGEPRDGTDAGGGDRGQRDGPRRPPRRNGGEPARPESFLGWVRWARTVDSGPVMVTREILSSVLLVAVVGGLLFAVSGVWPPMVAVQSGSMEPHMFRGDLVFIVDEHRFAPGGTAVEGTGVVPHVPAAERGYDKFGSAGDVIIYEPNGRADTDPIIHRAHFWVEAGENWYPKANESYVRADDCAELTNCPAPNSGFITKGDNPGTNRYYDQAMGMSRPVEPAWVKGKALVRVPGLGWVRLKFAEIGGAAAVGILVGGSSVGRAA